MDIAAIFFFLLSVVLFYHNLCLRQELQETVDGYEHELDLVDQEYVCLYKTKKDQEKTPGP